MTVDLDALNAAVAKATTESGESSAADEKLASVSDQLANLQVTVSEAIEESRRENEERIAAWQTVIDIITAGLPPQT